MKKVIIIGCPGAGKSVFARRLQAITALPLYHLDTIWHRPDKTHISREAFDCRLQEIFQKDRWILDGNYQRTLEARLCQCDTVFLLDYPAELCVAGAAARVGTREPICRGWKRNWTRRSDSKFWIFPRSSARRLTICWKNIKKEKPFAF